jgi:hypothetical protein
MVVSRVGSVGGSDQLVVAPTNQGQNGSSISSTRHVPRPPTLSTRCNLSNSPTRISQQSTALHLSTVSNAGGSCGAILDLCRHLEQMPALRCIALFDSSNSCRSHTGEWLHTVAKSAGRAVPGTLPYLPDATYLPMTQCWIGRMGRWLRS